MSSPSNPVEVEELNAYGELIKSNANLGRYDSNLYALIAFLKVLYEGSAQPEYHRKIETFTDLSPDVFRDPLIRGIFEHLQNIAYDFNIPKLENANRILLEKEVDYAISKSFMPPFGMSEDRILAELHFQKQSIYIALQNFELPSYSQIAGICDQCNSEFITSNLVGASNYVIHQTENGTEFNGDFLTDYSTKLQDLHNVVAKKERINKGIFSTMERLKGSILDEENDPFKTGIQGLDRVLKNCFPKGSYTCLISAPGNGKTVLAINIMYNQLIGKRPEDIGTIVFYSCELTQKRIFLRLMKLHARHLRQKGIKPPIHYTADDVKRWEYEQLAAFLAPFNEKFFLLHDLICIEDIERDLRDRSKTGPIDLVVIDYLQILELKDPEKSRWTNYERIKYCSKKIMQLRTELNTRFICVTLASTTNAKGTPFSKDNMPGQDDIKDCKQPAGDADLVLTLVREAPTDKNNKVIENMVQHLYVAIPKNRFGTPDLIVHNNFEGKDMYIW